MQNGAESKQEPTGSQAQHGERLQAVRAPDVTALLEANGSEVLGTAPEDLKAFISADIELWTSVVHARNIRAD